MPAPKPEDLRQLTDQVAANNGFLRRRDPADEKLMAALRTRIKHVIYIVKENRTYDQILGDLGRGNGDPSLTLFGAPGHAQRARAREDTSSRSTISWTRAK